jgi:uncharacterized protein (TIGR04255 family)
MTKLGTWKKPPLSYVVAEITFPAIGVNDKRLAKAKSILIDELPSHEMVEIEQLRPSSNNPPVVSTETAQLFDFRSIDNTQGVRLSAAGIQFHSVIYKDFAGFLGDCKLLKRALEEALSPKHLLRVGLRYVDIIVPEQGHHAEEYLIDSMRVPFDVPNLKVVRHDVVLQLQGEDTFCRVRVHQRPPAGQTLPPNFAAMAIALSAQQKSAIEYTKKEGAEIIFLDIDTGTIKPMVASNIDIDEIFSRLHKMQSSCFKQSMSKLALDTWE